jgi:hypothetical protein
MKQSQALGILLSGRNAFLTGGPGTGKSYVIREFTNRSRRVALTASTGIAATQVGGQTIHAWSGIGARRALYPSDAHAIKNGLAGARIRAADTHMALLASIRAGRCDPQDPRLLARHVRDRPEGIPFLSTHNTSVDASNVARLKELPGLAMTFSMTSEGPEHLVSALTRGCQSPEALTLKEGALVMFTRNDPDGRFVNGSGGVVVGMGSVDGRPMVRLMDDAEVTAAAMSWEIVEETDEEAIDVTAPARQATAATALRTEKRTLARICQIPLRLGWAITVHKSQGMSLDAAVMDLSRTFEYGQGYVALSRLRSLDGLYLMGLNEFALRVHPAVLAKDLEFRAASEALNEAYGRAELRRPGYSTFSAAVERELC